MDALIKISASEFNEDLFHKIKSLIKSAGDAEITIAVHHNPGGDAGKESKDEYWERIATAAADIQNGKGLTFTMEEFESYVRKNTQ